MNICPACNNNLNIYSTRPAFLGGIICLGCEAKLGYSSIERRRRSATAEFLTALLVSVVILPFYISFGWPKSSLYLLLPVGLVVFSVIGNVARKRYARLYPGAAWVVLKAGTVHPIINVGENHEAENEKEIGVLFGSRTTTALVVSYLFVGIFSIFFLSLGCLVIYSVIFGKAAEVGGVEQVRGFVVGIICLLVGGLASAGIWQAIRKTGSV